jgi:hypothetical protein
MHLSVLYKEFSILHLLFLSALSCYKGSIEPRYDGTDTGMDRDIRYGYGYGYDTEMDKLHIEAKLLQ